MSIYNIIVFEKYDRKMEFKKLIKLKGSKIKFLMTIIMLIVVIFKVLLIMLAYNTIINSSGTGTLSKTDYISILNTIFTAFMGFLGNIITVIGAYYIFKKENEEKDDLKHQQIEDLVEKLMESVTYSYEFTYLVCKNCINEGIYTRIKEDIYNFRQKNKISKQIDTLDILFGIWDIIGYKKVEKIKNLNRDTQFDLYIKTILDLSPYNEKIEMDAFHYDESIMIYLDRYDRKNIKKWLNMISIDKFNDFGEIYEFIDCREQIIKIINNKIALNYDVDYYKNNKIEFNELNQPIDDMCSEFMIKNIENKIV